MKRRIASIAVALALVLGSLMLFAPDAYAESQMQASDECVALIQSSEGFRAIPYWDHAQWTVGYGTECPAEDLERYQAEGIPVEEAHALFVSHLTRHENAVNKFIDKHGLSFTQAQFDALVSFTYNLGTSSLNKESYTIVQAILSGASDNELIYAFSVYCMAGGSFQPGLMRRRLAEANLFLNGVYDEYAPEHFCYVHYDATGGVRDASAQGYDSNLAAVPLSRPTKEGYTFAGWYTQAEGGERVISLNKSHHGMTLYAHWVAGTVEVEIPQGPTTGNNVTITGDTVNIRSGAGVSYDIVGSTNLGDIHTITATAEADGQLWGQCSHGWFCLEFTNYSDVTTPTPETPTQTVAPTLPTFATVIDPKGITVYNGPHTSYPKRGSLSKGDEILLQEYMVFEGEEWVRYEGGWIPFSGKLLIHDETILAHSFLLTVTDALSIRQGPGTGNTKVGVLAEGSTVTIFAVTTVKGTYWGRMDKGWITLAYSDFDAALLPQYQEHSYGQWYTVTEATCTAPGTEAQNCLYCDDTQTREIAQGAHSFGDWYIAAPASCAAVGTEQRDCTNCGQCEQRELPMLEHSFGDWYVAAPATCAAVGTEQRDCTNCGQCEQRELPMLEHSFGDWYETIPATTDEYGQERRDCTACGQFETRQTDKLPYWITRTYATVICDILRIRSGPSTNFPQVGKLETNDVVEILEQKTVGSEQWGRIEQGWICLTDLVRLETVEEIHTTHTYGEWEQVQAPTTSDSGLRQRQCTLCGHVEQEQIPPLTTQLLGDANSDGQINIRDVRLLLNYLANLVGEEAVNLAAADCTGDGQINIRDVRLLLSQIAEGGQ